MASKPTTWRTLNSRRVAAEASSYISRRGRTAADRRCRFRVEATTGREFCAPPGSVARRARSAENASSMLLDAADAVPLPTSPCPDRSSSRLRCRLPPVPGFRRLDPATSDVSVASIVGARVVEVANGRLVHLGKPVVAVRVCRCWLVGWRLAVVATRSLAMVSSCSPLPPSNLPVRDRVAPPVDVPQSSTVRD